MTEQIQDAPDEAAFIPSRKSKNKGVLFIVWVLVLAGLVWGTNKLSTVGPLPPQKQEIPKLDPKLLAAHWGDILKASSSPPRGLASAPFSLVEFGDFQCPQCGKMRPVIEGQIAAAPVNMYFVHRPFENEHVYALAAAEASDSAAAHGKFWQMYDALYSNQNNLEPGFYGDYATAIGLNGDQLRQDVEGGKYQTQVRASEKMCDKLGIQMTPTIIIRNNKNGVVVWASGKEMITKLLNTPPWAAASGAKGP